MKAHFPGSVFLRTLSKFKKRKKERFVVVSSCPPKSRSRGSLAVDVKEMYFLNLKKVQCCCFAHTINHFFGRFRFFPCRGCLSFQMLGDGKAS